MELKPEYQAIVDDIYSRVKNNLGFALIDTISLAVERCQALADRPVRMLTDDEIRCVIKATHSKTECEFSRAIEAAHIAKQSAPETVPFNFATWQAGGWLAIDYLGIRCSAIASGIAYPSMVREST